MTPVDARAPLFLLGMPRSGTTWLSQIFESSPDFTVRLSPNYSYPLKNELDLGSSRAAWLDHLQRAAVSDDPFMTQNWRRATGELGWFPQQSCPPTHLAIKDTRFHDLYQRATELLPNSQLIYVVRHPAGMVNSWWRSKEFPVGAELMSEWRTGTCRKDGPGEYWGFDDWCALTLGYLELQAVRPERYRVFRYEDLVVDPLRIASELFEFTGRELPPQTRAFLAASQSRHDERPYAVFKDPSVADRWRDELPSSIIDAIADELAGTPLEDFIT